MAWFTPFLIAAAMNAPSLLRSGNVGNFAKNTALGGATGNLLGNLVPADIMPTQVSGQVASQASQNLPLAMLGPESINQGILSTAGNAASVGGANLMSSPAEVMKSMDMTGFGVADPIYDYTNKIGPNLGFVGKQTVLEPSGPVVSAADLGDVGGMSKNPFLNQYTPNMGRVNPMPEAESYATKAAEVNKPLYERAYEKVANYVEENPIEAGMLGLTVAGGIYDTLYPEGEKPQFIPGQVRQPTKVELGQPLRIRRPFGRG